MEIRKVVKIRSSYFINLPSSIVEDLKIEKGDSLRVGNLPGYGIIITRNEGVDKISIDLESVEKIQRTADTVYSELKRKAKSLENSFVFNIGNRILGELIKTGWFDPKIGIEEVQSRIEKANEGRVKLVLLSNKKVCRK